MKICNNFILYLHRVMQRVFCLHLKWSKTGKYMGVLKEYKCNKCNKKIYRDKFNEPVSYVA